MIFRDYSLIKMYLCAENQKITGMQRTIYSSLLAWKEQADRKPLILLGARQVGKTYILKKFGKNEFDNMVYINCHENSFTTELFSDFNTQRILYQIEIQTNQKITIGKTLLVFDEIQEVKNGIASLKYFCEDLRQLHVAVAGSLLGISLKEGESYPVGKVNTLRMYPMTFSEFVLASDKHRMYEPVLTLDWDITATFHQELIEQLRQYYFVGGMPEAVAKWHDTHDPIAVRQIHSEILDSYYRDFSKHSKALIHRIHQVWNSIPAQLAKENKKFVWGVIKKGARATEFEEAIQWLVDAGLIYKVERTNNPVKPLKFYADHSAFKIYLCDCGLLAAMSDTTPREMLLGDNVFKEFKGAFTESYVLQQLMPLDNIQVYYYSKENSTQEIDFLLQLPERIVPMEVKAEENVKSKSLSTFVTQDHQAQHLKGLRCSMKPYIDQQWMENIPLYAVSPFIECAKDN